MTNASSKSNIWHRLYTMFSLPRLIRLTVVVICIIVGTAFYSLNYEETDIQFPLQSHMRLSDQLSSQQIKSITETSDGYIWIGTEAGLNRFDGNHYQQFFATNDSTSLINNDINNVIESQHYPGYLLVSTLNGTCIYCPDGTFLPIVDRLGYLYELSDGTLLHYAYHKITLYRFDPESRTCTPLRECLFEKPIMGLIPNTDRNFWVRTDNNLVLYNQHFEILQTVSFSSKIINGFARDTKTYWVLIPSGYVQMDMLTGQLTRTDDTAYASSLIQPELVFRQYYSNGLLAIKQSDQSVVLLVDLDKQSFIREPFAELMDTELGCVFRDSKGNIWAGSRGYGIQVLYAQHSMFSADEPLTSYFKKKDITGMTLNPQGELWLLIGRNRLYLCDQEHHIRCINTLALNHESIYHMTATADGHLLLVLLRQVIDCSLVGDRLVINHAYQTHSQLYSIFADEVQRIWVGSDEGVLLLNRDTQQLESTSVHLPRTNVIKQLPDRRLIVGSLNSGITTYNPETGEQQHFDMPPVKMGLFSCRDLSPDDDGIVWVASIGMGIYRLDLHTGNITNHQSPIMHTDVSCILADPYSDAVWMGTLAGLSRFEPQTGQFNTFFENDGVCGNEFFEKCALLTSDGLLLFGGKKGITIFDSRQITSEQQHPLHLSAVEVNQHLLPPGTCAWAPEGLSDGATLHLPYHNNTLQLHFTHFNYGDNAQSNMLYRVEDMQEDWVFAGDQVAYFSRLKPGHHTFCARLVNSLGEDISTYQLHLVVEYPWWSKSWMRWFCWPLFALLVVLIIFRSQRDAYVRRRRIRESLREKVSLKHISDMNIRYFTDVSHEFRTPLTLIRGAFDLLRDQQASSPQFQQSSHTIHVIQTNVDRMMRLVNQVLDFNRLENGMLPLRVQYQRLGVVATHIAEMFESGFAQKQIRFVNDFGHSDFLLWFDADKYEKVTFNLLSNALKFTPDGGTVILRTRIIDSDEAKALFAQSDRNLSAQWLLTQVVDTGIGIPTDELEAIFDRYYRAEQESMHVGGTGIGLCYCKGLVQLHHGFIKAENADEGNGSVFSFILPMADIYSSEEKVPTVTVDSELPAVAIKPNVEVADDAALPVDSAAATLSTIVAVDDDPEVLGYLKMLLGNEYNLITFTSASKAVESLSTAQPDLIISDIMMIGLDGYKFCNIIKSNPDYCHIPVILLTAKTTVDDHIQGLNAGADAYLTKPFDPAQLKAQIRNLFARRQKLQQLLLSATSVPTIQQASAELQHPDALFLERLYSYMEQHLSDTELDLTQLLDIIGMSRTKFFYKVKELTNQSPNAFFKTFKLNRAAQMIRERKEKITYIAEVTGFCSASHFASNFKKQFGVLPSEYGNN